MGDAWRRGDEAVDLRFLERVDEEANSVFRFVSVAQIIEAGAAPEVDASSAAFSDFCEADDVIFDFLGFNL